MKKEPAKEAAQTETRKKKRNVSKSTVTNPSVILPACHFSNSYRFCAHPAV